MYSEEYESDEHEYLDSPSDSDGESISSESNTSTDDEDDEYLLDSRGWKKVEALSSLPPAFTFIAAAGIDYAYDDDACELDLSYKYFFFSLNIELV